MDSTRYPKQDRAAVSVEPAFAFSFYLSGGVGGVPEVSYVVFQARGICYCSTESARHGGRGTPRHCLHGLTKGRAQRWPRGYSFLGCSKVEEETISGPRRLDPASFPSEAGHSLELGLIQEAGGPSVCQYSSLGRSPHNGKNKGFLGLYSPVPCQSDCTRARACVNWIFLSNLVDFYPRGERE